MQRHTQQAFIPTAASSDNDVLHRHRQENVRIGLVGYGFSQYPPLAFSCRPECICCLKMDAQGKEEYRMPAHTIGKKNAKVVTCVLRKCKGAAQAHVVAR